MPHLIASPHFVTHREINCLLGERTRQRWERDGLLPEPDWIRVDRHRLGLYPELVLARLVVGNTRDPIEQEAVQQTIARCGRLLATDGYSRFRGLVQAVFADAEDKSEWDFAGFVKVLGERGADVVAAWHADVAEIEEELTTTLSLSFRTTVGTVCEVTDDGYTVAMIDGGVRRVRDALVELGTGEGVILERVGVESREREFVLPGLVVAAGQGEDALLENGGSGMVVDVDNPFVQIGAREPFSAASLLELPGNAAMLSVRDEFERGRIQGLLPAEQDAPYVEPEQVFSFAFDSRLLDTHALV
jgi:hypothetical protein